jgi:hypothetical protein
VDEADAIQFPPAASDRGAEPVEFSDSSCSNSENGSDGGGVNNRPHSPEEDPDRTYGTIDPELVAGVSAAARAASDRSSEKYAPVRSAGIVPGNASIGNSMHHSATTAEQGGFGQLDGVGASWQDLPLVNQPTREGTVYDNIDEDDEGESVASNQSWCLCGGRRLLPFGRRVERFMRVCCCRSMCVWTSQHT